MDGFSSAFRALDYPGVEDVDKDLEEGLNELLAGDDLGLMAMDTPSHAAIDVSRRQFYEGKATASLSVLEGVSTETFGGLFDPEDPLDSFHRFLNGSEDTPVQEAIAPSDARKDSAFYEPSYVEEGFKLADGVDLSPSFGKDPKQSSVYASTFSDEGYKEGGATADLDSNLDAQDCQGRPGGGGTSLLTRDKKPQATGSTGRKLRVLKPKTSITTPKRDSTTRISKVPTKPRKRKDMSSTPLYLYCKDCGEKFMRACDLTRHLKTHTKPFKCTTLDCKYAEIGFAASKDCQRHIADRHEITRNFRCDFEGCTYSGSTRLSNLKQHREKKHGIVYHRTRGRRAFRSSAKGDSSEPSQRPHASPSASSATLQDSPRSIGTLSADVSPLHTGLPTPETSFRQESLSPLLSQSLDQWAPPLQVFACPLQGCQFRTARNAALKDHQERVHSSTANGFPTPPSPMAGSETSFSPVPSRSREVPDIGQAFQLGADKSASLLDGTDPYWDDVDGGFFRDAPAHVLNHFELGPGVPLVPVVFNEDLDRELSNA